MRTRDASGANCDDFQSTTLAEGDLARCAYCGELKNGLVKGNGRLVCQQCAEEISKKLATAVENEARQSERDHIKAAELAELFEASWNG